MANRKQFFKWSVKVSTKIKDLMMSELLNSAQKCCLRYHIDTSEYDIRIADLDSVNFSFLLIPKRRNL